MYLEEIMSNLDMENRKYECKSRLNRDDVVGWLKSVAGMANAEGGSFVVGAEDKTNKLIGFDRIDADNERNYFNNQVNEHLVPRPEMKIAFVKYEISGKERYIIHVEIMESPVKPVILKYKGVPAIYMRRDGFTNGATYEEIIQMSIRSQNSAYDTLVSDMSYNEASFNDLRSFCVKHTNGKEMSDKALLSMGFMNEHGMLANGAVLFSDGYFGQKTEVQCSVFSGINKGSERIVTVSKFNGNITSSIEFIMEFVQQRMNHSLIKLADGRMEIDAFPKRALFEGVINSVAHRDYFIDGTQVQIDMFKDRLEISSPGGFYLGDKFGKTYDLSGIISKRRNELITSVLVACNVMEAAGTGFDKIVEEYSAADNAHKPYICSSSDHFTLCLPDLTYEEGIENDNLPEISFVPPEKSTNNDERILRYCYPKARKVSEIAAYIGLSDSSYFRKNILKRLADQKYLVEGKESGILFYKTNPDTVRVL